MKNVIIFVLLTFCKELFADSQLFKKNEDLIKSSEIIAIIEVIEGSLTDSGDYLLKGKVVNKFKGLDDVKVLRFMHSREQISDVPNKIGGKYLVHINKIDGVYITNRNGFSVVELNGIPSDRPDIELALEKLNISSSRMAEDTSANLYWYPVLCTYASSQICEHVYILLNDAFNISD